MSHFGHDGGVCKMSADSTAPDYQFAHQLNAPSTSASSYQLTVLTPASAPLAMDLAHITPGAPSSSGSVASTTDTTQHIISPRSSTDTPELATSSRKRIHPSEESDICDEETESRAKCGGKTTNHSEIEKRRRDKMNKHILEIASLTPMCSSLSARKLDKLTVLRWAVQHIKNMRGSISNFSQGSYKPDFLQDHIVTNLINQASYGFLLVLACDSGRILYASQTSRSFIPLQNSHPGHSIFELIHPDDLHLLKSALTPIESQTTKSNERNLINISTIFSPGGKRRFCCRLRSIGSENQCATKPLSKNTTCKTSYTVFQCNGFLKSWSSVPPQNIVNSHINYSSNTGIDSPGIESTDALTYPSLVIYFQKCQNLVQTPTSSNISYPNVGLNIRLNLDGKIMYVEPRVHGLLGYLPQDMIRSLYYEYVKPQDVHLVSQIHRANKQMIPLISNDLNQRGVKSPDESNTSIHYRIRHSHGHFIKAKTVWRPFMNPWTKELQAIIVTHIFVD